MMIDQSAMLLMWFGNSGGRDVVFFMHGILDTSMGWVSNGVTGSQAFAAFDQGFDVWLGNSRANPPREHTGKHRHPICCRKVWLLQPGSLNINCYAQQLFYSACMSA